MGKIALQMKAQLEFINTIHAPQPEFRYFVKIKCTGCNEESEKWHDISLDDSVELKTGRGSCNFALKCKFCGKDNQLDILDKSIRPYLKEKEGLFQTIVEFDCRGMEPVAFSPREGWIAQSDEGGQKFEDVDLTDGEWIDYDEKLKESVRVYDLEFKFIKVK
ncbi:CXXC motif containing zinc binding protein [Thrips palmi]|uniref:CXXC motif containing zinc binding protein n=1 Tax=Thrips palmi TaxID=161013 RepID=A0A6P8YNX2_THRPL|nr:CXXC motif containing zinc binding protein [Thrips palmi]